ncbi:MAG: histidine phosphatase family protein [Lysobacteraceae bacterium]|nr:MAG: histidine phosphatase family protein [Xanthomonadaceae bacterium]
MDATRIIAVRHGETAWNVDTRIQGHLDIPLNDTGRWQAARLAAALADESIDAVYASDLGRAHETAQAVARNFGHTVNVEIGLRERAFGRFEGRTFAEIEATWPADAMRWRKRDPAFEPPEGGESLIAFRDRIVRTAHAIAARHPGGQVVMVGHGGVMDVLYRAATGQELHAPRSWALGNAAINRLLWTPDGLTLVGWSDTRHLDSSTLDETTT